MRTYIYRFIYVVVAISVALPYVVYLLHLDLSGRAITVFSLITSFSEPAPLRMFNIFIPGTQILMAALVLHRAFRFLHDRQFVPPSSFSSLLYWLGVFGVAALLLTILVFGLGALPSSAYSLVIGWAGVILLIAAGATIPFTFALSEMLSFRGYFKRA